jgi:sugar phosphate permease
LSLPTASTIATPLSPDQRHAVSTIWITYACYYLGRVNLSPVIPALAISLGVSRAEIGTLGTAFFWVYAIGQFINGELGTRISPHRIVTIGLLLIIITNLRLLFKRHYSLC